MHKRLEDKLIDPKLFYLFGTPIKHSLSPSMHNGAFKALQMPHHYEICERDDVMSYEHVITGDSFGGASVTIPHKENIGQFLDEIRGAANAIGAVNTIVVEDNESKGATQRRRIGYNTDWLGIKRPIEKLLQKSDRSSRTGKRIGIVIGAGGTARAACFAINSLGLELIVSNRSPDKGEAIAAVFSGDFKTYDDLCSLDGNDIEVIISTLPAQANFTVPDSLLTNKPIVFDVVYKPARTKLLDQALAHGCPVVQGATMLLEQGLEQFELWNKRRAPREIMEAAIFNGIEKLSHS